MIQHCKKPLRHCSWYKKKVGVLDAGYYIVLWVGNVVGQADTSAYEPLGDIVSVVKNHIIKALEGLPICATATVETGRFLEIGH